MNVIERLREAAEGWPQPNVYDDAVAAVDALYQAAKAVIDSMGVHPEKREPRGFSMASNDAAVALAAAVRRVEGQAQVRESFDLSADEDWGEA